MRQYSFVGRNDVQYVFVSRRNNRNIEMPRDTEPLPPDEEHGPPVETPPARPEDQPDPPPITEPNPDEPTRLV